MSEAQFPTPNPGPKWGVSARFADIDEQAAQLQGYGQHYEQLSRGRFDGCFASYYLRDSVSIHFERINRVLFQSGLSPAGRYTAMLLSEDSPPAIVNGAAFSSAELELWPPGHVFEGVMPCEMEVCVVSLPCEFVGGSGGAEIIARRIKDPRAAQQLRDLVKHGLVEFRQNPSAVRHVHATDRFAADIGDLLSETANGLRGNGRCDNMPSAGRRRSYKRALDLIHQNLPTGVSVASVCAGTGLSRRALEYLFESMLGMGPMHYIRALQLNAIRRALLDEETVCESIGDVAARYGIWHWSKFSAAYSRMFGELPSETRSRALQSISVGGVRRDRAHGADTD